MRLFESGMLSWRVGGPSLLGIFFVIKKSSMIRMILDTRGRNKFFQPHASTRHPSGAAFVEMDASPNGPVYFASGDIKDCFYHLGVPPGLEQWFSLPWIHRRHLPKNLTGITSEDPDAWIVPLLTVLPMGWSWSLYFAQMAHETLSRRAGCSDSNHILAKMESIPLNEGGCRMAIYVDNYSIAGRDRREVLERQKAHTRTLISHGLPVHEETSNQTEVDYVWATL